MGFTPTVRRRAGEEPPLFNSVSNSVQPTDIEETASTTLQSAAPEVGNPLSTEDTTVDLNRLQKQSTYCPSLMKNGNDLMILTASPGFVDRISPPCWI